MVDFQIDNGFETSSGHFLFVENVNFGFLIKN